MRGLSRLPDLSKEVAAFLTANSLAQYAANHNSNVVYPMPELAELKVDVWPASLLRTPGTRTNWNRFPTLNIAVQRRASTQEDKDLLTNLVDDIIDGLLGRRFVDSKYYCHDAGFAGSDIYDRFEAYDKNIFVSVLSINFQWFL